MTGLGMSACTIWGTWLPTAPVRKPLCAGLAGLATRQLAWSFTKWLAHYKLLL